MRKKTLFLTAVFMLFPLLLIVFTVPSAAQQESKHNHDYYKTVIQRCNCIIDPSFEINFESGISEDGSSVFAITSATHCSEQCPCVIVGFTQTTWYLPSNTTSAYSTYLDYNAKIFEPHFKGLTVSMYNYRKAEGGQKLIYTETNHFAETRCDRSFRNYTAITRAGTAPQ